MQAREYFTVIGERKWLILVAMIIVAVGAYAVSVGQPAQYQSEAVVLWAQRNPGTAVLGMPQPQVSNFPDLEIATQVGLVQQPGIAEQAILDLGLNITPEALLRKLSVSGDGRTSLITITAVDATPQGAAAIANAVAGAYARSSRDANQRSLSSAADEVRRSLEATHRQIAALDASEAIRPSTANQAELQASRNLYGTLLAQLQKLQSAQELETGSISIVGTAVADPVPTSPKPVRDAALGLAVGLVLGLGIAFISNSLDTRLKSPEEASAAYAAPLLGQIPDERTKKGETVDAAVLAFPDGPVAESYRGLRNNMEFVNFDRSIKTLMVTSAIPGEGKSTVAANLSVVLAQAGWRVVLVVVDFRRTAAESLLGLARSPGLSEVLAGTSELASAIQDGPAGLRVLSSGETPRSPSDMLGSAAMRLLLAVLVESADLVVVDTPPLLAVADAATIARWADAAVVVTRDGMTTREAARMAREHLDGVGERVIGVVVTGVKNSGAARSGYDIYSGYYRKE